MIIYRHGSGFIKNLYFGINSADYNRNVDKISSAELTFLASKNSGNAVDKRIEVKSLNLKV